MRKKKKRRRGVTNRKRFQTLKYLNVTDKKFTKSSNLHFLENPEYQKQITILPLGLIFTKIQNS